MSQAERIAGCLGRWRFRHQDEAELQEAIASALRLDLIPFEREVRLSETDRVDFLCERTAVEVKIGGPVNHLVRQLARYAQSPRVDDLLVVTTRRAHCTLPEVLNGKPLRLVHLGAL